MHKHNLVCVSSVGDLIVYNDIQSEYFAWINTMLMREHNCSLSPFAIQQIMDETANNWSLYSGCLGRFFLAYIGNCVCGMAGIKYVSKDICELKRLYVSPRYRRAGLGRSLVERLVAEARILGYNKMRLETLDFMVDAIRLYESLGFLKIAEFDGTEGRGYGIHQYEICFALDLHVLT